MAADARTLPRLSFSGIRFPPRDRPGAAMQLDESDFAAADRDAHAVIAEMKVAGVYRFGGGIDENVAAVQVAADGTVTPQSYPQSRELGGGMTIIDVDTREEALECGDPVDQQ